MKNSKGIIFDIKKYSVHDGPGIRTTVFMKGCPLNCWWCHNPESQNKKPDMVSGASSKRESHIQYGRDNEIIGKEMSVDEVMEEIRKDIIFYDESGGGVTFSGGEPLFQPEFLLALLSECRKDEIHTAIDTCGYASSEDLKKILPLTDLFLFDIKLLDDGKHKKYTGVNLHPIKENLIFLSQQNTAINIRIPIIPKITDDTVNINQIIKFLSRLNNIIKISLLPLNHLGDKKYKDLGKVNKLIDTPVPEEDEINRIQQRFQAQGYEVDIGG